MTLLPSQKPKSTVAKSSSGISLGSDLSGGDGCYHASIWVAKSMPYTRLPSRKKTSDSNGVPVGLRRALNYTTVTLALMFLISNLVGPIILNFANGFGSGLRSLAAGVLPILIAVYVGFLINLKVPANESLAPAVNNFVIFTLWTLLIIGLDQTYEFMGAPFKELLYSLTLATLIWRYKRRNSFETLVSCCYGIVCGWLSALVLFGWV